MVPVPVNAYLEWDVVSLLDETALMSSGTLPRQIRPLVLLSLHCLAHKKYDVLQYFLFLNA